MKDFRKFLLNLSNFWSWSSFERTSAAVLGCATPAVYVELLSHID
jgi:hypothetical protein